MVTTRSADRQNNSSKQEEKLALRSRSGEIQSLEQPLEPGTPTPASSRKKGKVWVKVPPPRDQIKSSDDTADNTGEKGSSYNGIPDSQDSPVKSISKKQLNLKSDFIPLEEDKSSSDVQASNKRKRIGTEKMSPNKKTMTIPKTVPVAAGKHRRFGSKQPSNNEASDEEQESAIQSRVPLKSLQVEKSNDDDAPEMTSTKSASARTSRRTKGKPPTAKPTVATKTDQVTPNQNAAEPEGTELEIIEEAQPPNLTVNTSQDVDTTIGLESEDSNDSAFVTARTNRHVDMFATPIGGTPQILSPNPGRIDIMPANSTAITKLSDIDTDHTPKDLDRMKLTKATITSVKPDASSVALPRKAGNSLEDYRQQMMENRAAKSTSRNRGRFRLQEEWSSKRRRFVVGY